MTLHNLRSTLVTAAEEASTSANAADCSAPAPPASRSVRAFAPTDTLLQLVYHNLDRQLETLGQEIRRAAISGVTVDAVHAMRTGSRRIRATLKIFREMLPREVCQRLGGEVAWLARELGSVRDLDVQLAMLERDGPEHNGPEHNAPTTSVRDYTLRLADEREAAARQVLQTLQGSRVQTLLDEFHAFLSREPSAAAARRWADLGALEGAEDFALRALRRVRKMGRRIAHDTSSAEGLHDLRIRCKRFRYLLESLEPVCGERLDRPIQLTRRLQDTLGSNQDARVAIERLERELKAAREVHGEEAASPLAAVLEALQQEVGDAEAAFRRNWHSFERGVRKRRLRKRIRAARRHVS